MSRSSFLLVAVAASVLMLVAACSGGEVSSTPTQTSMPTSQPAATATSSPQPIATNQLQPTTTSQPPSAATPTSPAPGLTLNISEPKDETVVTDSLLKVAGRTAPDAVVSVNGAIVKTIDANGNFATVVPLVEGPNLVEVIASDYQNNQQSQTLTVIYAP